MLTISSPPIVCEPGKEANEGTRWMWEGRRTREPDGSARLEWCSCHQPSLPLEQAAWNKTLVDELRGITFASIAPPPRSIRRKMFIKLHRVQIVEPVEREGCVARWSDGQVVLRRKQDTTMHRASSLAAVIRSTAWRDRRSLMFLSFEISSRAPKAPTLRSGSDESVAMKKDTSTQSPTDQSIKLLHPPTEKPQSRLKTTTLGRSG